LRNINPICVIFSLDGFISYIYVYYYIDIKQIVVSIISGEKMIDIKMLVANPETFKTALGARGLNPDIVGKIIELDSQRRKLTTENDEFKRIRNESSKKVGMLKSKGEDATELMEETKQLGIRIADNNKNLDEIKVELDSIALTLPNTPLPDVPIGKTEAENVHVRTWGSPSAFDFEVKAHWDLGQNLDILDQERASKLSGARFTMFKAGAAALQRALINYMIELHTTKHGFSEVFAPVLVLDKTCLGTGQLPKFAGDMYKIEDEQLYLVSTNEITLTNMHSGEILKGSDLPIRYTGFALCFRKEAGAAGRDTRGLIRVHQFEKVEMVTLCKPEDSEKELQHLVKSASTVLESLELPHRVSLMCTGDMSGFSAAKCYDLEVWMPSYNNYVEVSSCSNCTDFQARRAGIRFKDAQGDQSRFVHTLNGSGLAIGRTIAAIMENYQTSDGRIRVPEVLKKYFTSDYIEGIIK
jgi:seryl-tRNA synthetase